MNPVDPSDPSPPPDAVPSPAGSVPQPPGHDPIILTIGDIGVSRHWVVTPNGTAPLAGSQWLARDLSTTESKIPAWAIVLAVIFAFACLIGLLFLLVKEQRTTGYFEVSVRSGTLFHVTQIPISSAYQIAQTRQLVHQAQTLAAATQG